MSLALTALKLFAPTISTTLGKLIPDSDKRDEIEREIKLGVLENQHFIDGQAGNIILAEAKSDSWLTSSWRPLLMMVIVIIVAVHYLVFPLINLLFATELMIELPQELWTLLTVGVGGYTVGRSGEKMMKKYKETDL